MKCHKKRLVTYYVAEHADVLHDTTNKSEMFTTEYKEFAINLITHLRGEYEEYDYRILTIK